MAKKTLKKGKKLLGTKTLRKAGGDPSSAGKVFL